MNAFADIKKELENIISSSTGSRAEFNEKSEAIRRVLKSARELKGNLERLEKVNEKWS